MKACYMLTLGIALRFSPPSHFTLRKFLVEAMNSAIRSTLARILVTALYVHAESHTVTFTNNCGYGTVGHLLLLASTH